MLVFPLMKTIGSALILRNWWISELVVELVSCLQVAKTSKRNPPDQIRIWLMPCLLLSKESFVREFGAIERAATWCEYILSSRSVTNRLHYRSFGWWSFCLRHREWQSAVTDLVHRVNRNIDQAASGVVKGAKRHVFFSNLKALCSKEKRITKW